MGLGFRAEGLKFRIWRLSLRVLGFLLGTRLKISGFRV